MPYLRIDLCREEELPLVQSLAHRIWRAHYPGIISDAQIDYMLARGYSSDALAPFLRTRHAGIALARLDQVPVGFVAWYPPGEPATLKLDKLYVLPAKHGMGIGRRLIAHVEAAARAACCTQVILNVNKRNRGAIAAYECCGYSVREAVVVDIGSGFVMDDFVLVRQMG